MGEMLGWQALGEPWTCDGDGEVHAEMGRGARVWIEAGGRCFCSSCGELRERLSMRGRPCMAPGCEEEIPEGKPPTQATCSRRCSARLRAANAAAAEARDGEALDGATAL